MESASVKFSQSNAFVRGESNEHTDDAIKTIGSNTGTIDSASKHQDVDPKEQQQQQQQQQSLQQPEYDVDGNTETETKSVSSAKSMGSNQELRYFTFHFVCPPHRIL